MTEPWNGSGRGCTADNFFTSFNLADALLTRNITYCKQLETVEQLDRIGVFFQRRFWISNKEVSIQVFLFPRRKDAGIVYSYIPKRGKNVILMSTMIHDEREDKKPGIILHYNRTKGAVDNVDELVKTYSCRRNSRRWPMIFFQNLLNIAVYNAAVVFFCY